MPNLPASSLNSSSSSAGSSSTLNINVVFLKDIADINIEGKIDRSLLKEIGKDPIWLKKIIAPTYAEIRDVILATIDENENVHVYSLHDNHSINVNTTVDSK